MTHRVFDKRTVMRHQTPRVAISQLARTNVLLLTKLSQHVSRYSANLGDFGSFWSQTDESGRAKDDFLSALDRVFEFEIDL